MTTIDIPGPVAQDGGATTMPAYLSTPAAAAAGPGPWPGVVVVHDAFGASADMNDQADWLAAAGYVAVVPDLYSRDGRTQGWGRVPCVARALQDLSRGTGAAFARIEATRAALAAREDCTGDVGVIGFCMGGGFALVLAGRPGWSASSANYGVMPKDLDEVLDGACPVVASYGGDDPTLRGAADQVEGALTRAGVPHDVEEYPGAKHGFVTRTAVASPLVPLMRVLGVAHDHEASADARRRILAFFAEHLRPGREQGDAAGATSAGAPAPGDPTASTSGPEGTTPGSAPLGWPGGTGPRPR